MINTTAKVVVRRHRRHRHLLNEDDLAVALTNEHEHHNRRHRRHRHPENAYYDVHKPDRRHAWESHGVHGGVKAERKLKHRRGTRVITLTESQERYVNNQFEHDPNVKHMVRERLQRRPLKTDDA